MRKATNTAGFSGFSPEAFEFFASLAANNSREWFQDHRHVYERECRAPMKLLVEELAGPGRAKLSRINRDTRFLRGRPPYRGYIAAGFDGNYLSLSANGAFIGSGLYRPAGEVLKRFRVAVDDEDSGEALATLLSSLVERGYIVDTHERTRGVPRGLRPDHPRAELLQMKGLFGGKIFAPSPELSMGASLEEFRRAIDDLRPLATWIREKVAPDSADPR
jgi:uncharacterized protein (TIGR02453 family)